MVRNRNMNNHRVLLATLLAITINVLGCGPSRKSDRQRAASQPGLGITVAVPAGTSPYQEARLNAIALDAASWVTGFMGLPTVPHRFNWSNDPNACPSGFYSGCAYTLGPVYLYTGAAEYAAHEELHVLISAHPQHPEFAALGRGDPTHSHWAWAFANAQGYVIVANHP